MRYQHKPDEKLPNASALGLYTLGSSMTFRDPKQAEKLLLRALRQVGDHPLAAAVYQSLGIAYGHMERRDEAAAISLKGLQWAEEKLGLLAAETRMLRANYAWPHCIDWSTHLMHSSDRDERFVQCATALYEDAIKRASASGSPEAEGLLTADLARVIEEHTILQDKVAEQLYEKAAPLLLAHQDKLPPRVIADPLLRLAIVKRLHAVGQDDGAFLKQAVAVLEADHKEAETLRHYVLKAVCEALSVRHRYLSR
jgi:tetratricopeptide (TPR) repeat protein